MTTICGMRRLVLLAALLLPACLDNDDPPGVPDAGQCTAPPPCDETVMTCPVEFCTMQIVRDGQAITCSIEAGEPGCADGPLAHGRS